MKKIFYLTILLFNPGLYAMGWDTINPGPDDDKYFIHVEGILNFELDKNTLPDRHTYFWTHLTGGYEIVDNFWISGWLSLYNRSFSDAIAYHPIGFNILPQLTYSNRHTDKVESNINLDKNNLPDFEMEVNAITVGDFTHGKGLFFSQMTSYGSHVYMNINNTSIDFNYILHGYWLNDQVFSFFIYPFKKFIGMGVLWEKDGYMGDRIVPGLNAEITVWKQIRFYAEYGVGYVFEHYNYGYPVSFSSDFNIDRNTSAGIFGIDWKFNFPAVLKLEGNLANQIRYYGAEHSDFYYYQTLYLRGFNYYFDSSIDQKYNNQPHNFYFDRGEKLGFYFRQEVKINPYNNIFLSVKNELLLIYPTGDASGSYDPYTVDLLTIDLFYQFAQKIDLGFRFSNVGISAYESHNFEYLPQENRKSSEGIMLKPTESWYMELYSHFKF